MRRRRSVPSDYWLPYEVAVLLGMSESSVWLAMRDKRITAERVDGRWLIRRCPMEKLYIAFPSKFPGPISRRFLNRLYDQWIDEYDIRGIGERAVKETA